MSTNTPLLIFPEPGNIDRRKLGSGGGDIRLPGRTRQGKRLSPKFLELQRAFKRQLARVSADASGVAPEQVVVFETIGGVDKFQRAAERAGMEWLGEIDIEDIPPDDDFVRDRDAAKLLPRRLYLTIANQKAVQQLLALWSSWEANGKEALPYGFKKWGDLLECLRDVRPWGPSERLEETGILEDWAERVSAGHETVRFQIELWYRPGESIRKQIHDRVVRHLGEESGKLVSECVIGEIHYHGMLAELPIESIERFLKSSDASLLHAQEVMFFRPCAQGALRTTPEELGETVIERDLPLPSGEPVVALLDGMPIENHSLLGERILVDDPDGLSEFYPVDSREHGTAMASIIVHGDLAENGPGLPTPLYVRPIMKPQRSFDGFQEQIPPDRLVVDIVHQAVRRICDPVAGAVASSVRVINVSLGDLDYPFGGFLSPWARLLDWLSSKYGVLFVVSAGNSNADLELTVSPEAAEKMSAEELQSEVLLSIALDARNRAILAPAEGINVLSVGASNSDFSDLSPPPGINVLVQSDALPATYSRLGLGYRRGIKPDVLAPGGRGWHRMAIAADTNAVYQMVRSRRAAGLAHACPGQHGAAATLSGRTVGTSNAAAYCSRHLGFAYNELAQLLASNSVDPIDPAHEALLLRALSVHTADWGAAGEEFAPILLPSVGSRGLREHTSRFVGYGHLRPDRMTSCTDQRATVLGFSRLREDEAHQYLLPIPQDLSGYRGYKRLAVTLAWFSPTNSRHREYKRAAMWFDLPDLNLPVARKQANDKAAKRGTLQHEILEGEKAGVFSAGSEVIVNVNCRAAAGGLDEAVPYALVCSLEVAEGVEIPVYNEIRQRLQARIRAGADPVA